MTKLKPCPFCGSDNLSIRSYYVTCVDCQSDGPLTKDDYEEDVLAAWNTRYEPLYGANGKQCQEDDGSFLYDSEGNQFKNIDN